MKERERVRDYVRVVLLLLVVFFTRLPRDSSQKSGNIQEHAADERVPGRSKKKSPGLHVQAALKTEVALGVISKPAKSRETARARERPKEQQLNLEAGPESGP